MEGGIDVLDHATNITLVFCYELEHFPELLLERPVPQLLNISSLYLIHRQELLVMLLVCLEETGLTYQPTWLLTLRIYTDVEDIMTIIPF